MKSLRKEKERLKQGIEVEGYIRTIEEIEAMDNSLFHGKPYRRIRRPSFPDEINDLLLDSDYLWKRPHWDTGDCTEIDLNPRKHLGDFRDLLVNALTQVYDYSDRKEYLYMLLGVVPVSRYAGAHQHLSFYNYSNTELIYKLYVFQPFISLLGQNSSLVRKSKYVKDTNGSDYYLPYYVPSNTKDTRIEYERGGLTSHDFKTDYDCDDIEDQEEYEQCMEECENIGMLDPDFELHTLEVRYPSSASLYQTLGVATFLKACVYQKGNILQDGDYDWELTKMLEGILSLGSLTPVDLYYKEKSVRTNIGTLFDMLIDSPVFREGLEEALSELDVRDQIEVMKFYRIFGKGLSMTDYYNEILKNKTVLEACKALHREEELEFFKGYNIIDRYKPKPSFDKEEARYIMSSVPSIDARVYGIEDQIEKVVDKTNLSLSLPFSIK